MLTPPAHPEPFHMLTHNNRDTMNWHEYLAADFEAGTLTWKSRDHGFKGDRHKKMFHTKHAGKVAGSTDKYGYCLVVLLGKSHKAHRILWEMANGPIPEGMQIDHIDRNKGNNSRTNLRLVTHSQNMHNRALFHSTKSGAKGVTERPNVEANRRRSGAGASGLAVSVCYPPCFFLS